MKRSTLISLLIALAFLGVVDAFYLAEAAMTGSDLVCDIEGLSDCNIVAQSAYSKLFGIPLGVYGLLFYAVFLLLALLAAFRHTKVLDRVMAVLSVLGIIASGYFLYIQLALIKAVCIYCLASGAIAVLLGVVSYLLVRPKSEPLPAET